MKSHKVSSLSLERFTETKDHRRRHIQKLKKRENYKNANTIRRYKKLLQAEGVSPSSSKFFRRKDGAESDNTASKDSADEYTGHDQRRSRTGPNTEPTAPIKSKDPGPGKTKGDKKGNKPPRKQTTLEHLQRKYERSRQEKEEAKRQEREAAAHKRQELEAAKAARREKQLRLMARTRKGQPVLKYQMANILDKLQADKKKK